MISPATIHPPSPAQTIPGTAPAPIKTAPSPYVATAPTSGGFPWGLVLLGVGAFGVVYFIRRRRAKKH